MSEEVSSGTKEDFREGGWVLFYSLIPTSLTFLCVSYFNRTLEVTPQSLSPVQGRTQVGRSKESPATPGVLSRPAHPSPWS